MLRVFLVWYGIETDSLDRIFLNEVQAEEYVERRNDSDNDDIYKGTYYIEERAVIE